MTSWILTPDGYIGTEVFDLPEGKLEVRRVFQMIGDDMAYPGCRETLRTAYLDGEPVLDWRRARELYARARQAELSR